MKIPARAVLLILCLVLVVIPIFTSAQLKTPVPTGVATPSATPYLMMFKDGEMIPVPYKTPEPRNKFSIRADEEADRIFREESAKIAKQYGTTPGYVIPGENLKPGTEIVFELPQEQRLKNCIYAAGFSFPSKCEDENGAVVFEAGKDPQSVLDSLKADQGIRGPYNVVPDDYRIEENDPPTIP